MKKPNNLLLFCAGGLGYLGLELAWRGWTHYSMFFAGGSCFLLLGKLNETRPPLPLPLRAILGAGVITSVELLTGLLVNRDYAVWDYRDRPGNFLGQICPLYSLLWIPVAFGAGQLYRLFAASWCRVLMKLTEVFRKIPVPLGVG